VAVNLQSNAVAVALSRRSKAASRASIALVGGDRGNQPPAGASLMIVVRLVSATRRPTVH
jgi:hypothetical protein